MGRQEFLLDQFKKRHETSFLKKGGGGGRRIRKLRIHKQDKGILFANLNLIVGKGCFHYPLSIVILLFYRIFFISSKKNWETNFLKIQFLVCSEKKGGGKNPPCPRFFFSRSKPYSNKNLLSLYFSSLQPLKWLCV